MTALENLVHTPVAGAFGWTLFHSLWEGAALAMVLAIVLAAIRSPRIRYACACLAMLGILAGFVFTFFGLMPEQLGKPAVVIRSGAHAFPGQQPWMNFSERLKMADILPWLTPFWIAGMMLFHLRAIANYRSARRLRRTGICAAPEAWRQKLNQLSARVRVARPVALFETCLADVPVVIGYMRPVILAPLGMLAGMPAGQIEAILLHELAHIRRRDYLVNLLQTAAEGFLFYHPAVWWISGVIRAEREKCCDDIAVAACGNAHEYGTALTALEESRWTENQVMLAAAGGVLVKRIRRLLYPRESSRAFLAPLFSAGILVIVTALALTAWQSKPAENAQTQTLSAFNTWLNVDVAYIVTDAERKAFEQLQTDDERSKFIEQFWLRRDPTPGTVENEFRDEHYRRIAYANGHFSSRSGMLGWKADRGRIYITFGPPDEIDSHPGGPPGKPPYEDWLYRFIEGVGKDVSMEFIDPDSSGEFHMTMDPNGKGAALIKPANVEKSDAPKNRN